MKTRFGSALVALLVLGAVAPGALASTPARTSVQLYLPDAFFVHRQALTVPERFLHVQGVVRPYVRDQWVDVRISVGRRLVKSARLRLKPSRRGVYGGFTE